MKKVMFSVVHDVMIKLRFEVVEAVLRSGYETYIVCPHGETVEKLVKMGCKHIDISFNRHSANIFDNLKLLRLYEQIYSSVMPDIVFSYSAQPNIYGGLACKKLKIPYAANISGLGGALGNPGILQPIMIRLYKKALSGANVVFFQNKSNEEFFTKRKITSGQNVLLPGSGVNLQKFQYSEYPKNYDSLKFLFIGRIMKEKGIEQYLDMAKAIREKYPNTMFYICGFYEQDYKKEIDTLHKQKIVNYHGTVTDISTVLKDIHCLVHPTYYPEGMSNVLLESFACARPAIATNRAGCREIIDDGINGFFIKEKDSADLINKVEQFISLPYEKKVEMGLSGRKKVEKKFDRKIVIEKYMEVISGIL